MLCPKCGYNAEENDTFCVMCGCDFLKENHKIPEATKNNKTIKCLKCGTENGINDSFCAECGTPLPKNPNEKSNIEEKTDATSTKENVEIGKIYKRPFICHVIVEFILYSIFVFGVSFWFAILIPEFASETNKNLYSSSEIDNAANIMHQIYYLASNANARIINESLVTYTIFGAISGLLLVFSIWSVLRYNRLEKRIIDTQELIVELRSKIKE